MRKAEDVVSTMLARGFVLSKDALRRAQTFDGRHHQLLSSATSRVAYLDRRLGLSDKFSVGTAAARGAARGVDERFQVTERARGAFAAAGEVVAGPPTRRAAPRGCRRRWAPSPGPRPTSAP